MFLQAVLVIFREETSAIVFYWAYGGLLGCASAIKQDVWFIKRNLF